VTFLTPWMLLALLVVPSAVAFALVVDRRAPRSAVAFTNLDVLAQQLGRGHRWRRWVPPAFLVLALACASTALARPTAVLTAVERRATVVFLVDVSGSMRADDVEPTRLDAAVNAMRAFLARVPPWFDVGLVTLSSRPDVLVTPTRDRRLLYESLAYLTPSGGTALGDGLAAAVKLTVSSLAREGVHASGGHYLPAAIVLESDGAQNVGVLQPVAAARMARAASIRVDGIALGRRDGSISYDVGAHKTSVPVPPDPGTVRMISSLTGGKAYAVETAASAVDVYKALGSAVGRTRERREISSWFAVAAAGLLVAAIGAGRLAQGALT
jgi:Ca-activated chloride channel homolog